MINPGRDSSQGWVQLETHLIRVWGRLRARDALGC